MNRRPAHLPDLRRGLTLLELLAVLMILAITTTIAVVSTQGVLDQSRYEATQTTLQQLKQAVVGRQDARQTDGTVVVSGFVADTGRLPQDVEELLAKPDDLVEFTTEPVSGVPLPRGWNGPYLETGIGQSEPLDGWGRSFVFRLPDATSAEITSQGADGDSDLPEDGYDRDLVLSIVPADYTASLVQLQLKQFDEYGQVVPFALDTGAGETVVSLTVLRANPDESTGAESHHANVVGAVARYPDSVNPALRIGTVAVFAQCFQGTELSRQSDVTYLTLTPRSTILRDIVLPRPPQTTEETPLP